MSLESFETPQRKAWLSLLSAQLVGTLTSCPPGHHTRGLSATKVRAGWSWIKSRCDLSSCWILFGALSPQSQPSLEPYRKAPWGYQKKIPGDPRWISSPLTVRIPSLAAPSEQTQKFYFLGFKGQPIVQPVNVYRLPSIMGILDTINNALGAHKPSIEQTDSWDSLETGQWFLPEGRVAWDQSYPLALQRGLFPHGGTYQGQSLRISFGVCWGF